MRSLHLCLWAALSTLIAAPCAGAFSPAFAAVYTPQQALPAQTIKEFLSDPNSLLTQFPDGGAQMIARVRDLAASDPATLDPIIALLASSNGKQATSIGTGLGQVALMAVRTDQAYAASIQEALAKANTALPAANNGRPVVPETGPGSAENRQRRYRQRPSGR
jgi:hypothetical protein